MVIKNTTSGPRTFSAPIRPHPLCNDTLPTHESCVAGQPPPLDQYKEFTDWVPFFYAPPQYRFCRAFDEWYYRSCVPATQEARADIRDIAQKNGDTGSKKDLTDQINGTFNRTEDACAGIDPSILKETVDRCDAIVDIHKKNRIIMGLVAFIIVKGFFTVLAIRHTSRSWSEMKAAARKVWNEVKAAYEEKGVRQAAKRSWKGIGHVWNAREGGFREQVTDINIFFAKLLEFTDSREDKDIALAKWNEVKKQKGLSAEKKFERFKEVVREEFEGNILSIIDELETGIVKELIFQSGRFERLAASIEAGEDIDAHLLIREISGPIKRLHETLLLFAANAELFNDSKEVERRLARLRELSGNLLQVLNDANSLSNKGGLFRDEGREKSKAIVHQLRSYDLRRIDSVIGLAARLAASSEIEVEVSDIPDIKFQGAEEILGLYNTVQLIIDSFRRYERPYLYGSERAGQVTSHIDISAEAKDGKVRIKVAGQNLPDYLGWSEARRAAAELGWRILLGNSTREVVLKIDTRPGKVDPKVLREVTDAVQGLHFAAAHFKFNDAVKFTKDLIESLEDTRAEPVAAALTNDIIPLVERIYSKFEMEFYEEIFPRIGDYMGQLYDAHKKGNHEQLVEYLSGHITTVMKYAGYLRDNLTGFAELANWQKMRAPASLTPEWQAVAGKFWGITHDIGNVLGVLIMTVESVGEGDMKYARKFDLTNFSGLVEAVKIINEQQAVIDRVKITMDDIPEIAIPRPSHVSTFRMINELVTNSVKYADREKPERKVMVLYEIDGAKTEVINDDESVRKLDDRKLFIVVADNGVGISDIAAARSGERLRKDLADGTGTGLKTMAGLAEKEGWEFDISSNLNALNIPDALRARIKGMSTAAVLTIDISKWEGASPAGTGGGQAPAPTSGENAGGGDANDLSSGENAMMEGAQYGLGAQDTAIGLGGLGLPGMPMLLAPRVR